MVLFRVLAVTVLCLPTLTSNVVMAADNRSFQVRPLAENDKKEITAIFKPLESKWVSSEELSKYPGLYWQDDLQEQSFKIVSTQKGLEDVYFVPIQTDYTDRTKAKRLWSQCVSFLIINRKDSKIRVLPAHPAMDWSFYQVRSVAFRAVQGNGQRAIVVNVAAITGIGPTGARPFDVFAVYLPIADGSWVLDEKLQRRIDEQLNDRDDNEDSRTLEAVLKVARSYFKKK